MIIIRDHSYLFVCLAAACGGARDPSNLALQEHDRAVTAATADSPHQAEIVWANKVMFFGRSSAPADTSVTATTFDSRRVPRTCTGKVLKDQTWSCQQTLADGGFTWTAQVASGGPVSQQIDFVVSTGLYPAPTIDHTPSPNSDPKPLLTGTVISQLVNRGFYLEVTENGQAICIVSPIRSTNWACPLSTKLADGPHILSVDVDESDGDEATPWGNSNAFTVKTSIGNPTLAAVPTPRHRRGRSERDRDRQLLPPAVLGARQRLRGVELRARLPGGGRRLPLDGVPDDAGGKPQWPLRRGAAQRAHAENAGVRCALLADARDLALAHRTRSSRGRRLRLSRRGEGLYTHGRLLRRVELQAVPAGGRRVPVPSGGDRSAQPSLHPQCRP